MTKLTLLASDGRRKTQVFSKCFPCIVDYNTDILCNVIQRHILFKHRSTILSEGFFLTTVGKTATYCPFVRLLVAENDKAKKRNLRFRAKELSVERSCG